MWPFCQSNQHCNRGRVIAVVRCYPQFLYPLSGILTIFPVSIVDPIPWAKVERMKDLRMAKRRGQVSEYLRLSTTLPLLTTFAALLPANYPRATATEGKLECFPFQGCGKCCTTNDGCSGESMNHDMCISSSCYRARPHLNISIFVPGRIIDY
jgi:hypothetical protein